MARTKKLTREFDSAIDRDFLQNKILYDAFAKLAAEQDVYNMSKGYPLNGTTGELPIHKYGGKRKFQTGSGLMTQGANVINDKHINTLIEKFKQGDPAVEELFSNNPDLVNRFLDSNYIAVSPETGKLRYLPSGDTRDNDKMFEYANSRYLGDKVTIPAKTSLYEIPVDAPNYVTRIPGSPGYGDDNYTTNPVLSSSEEKSSYTGNPKDFNKLVQDYINNRKPYKETALDKVGKWGALAPGLVGIAAAFQNNKKFGKFPHYTPKDMDTTALQNMLVNQGQLATNNAINAVRGANPGSSGAYMSNVGNISGRSQEETAKALAQLALSTGQINKQALDRSKEFNALQDEKANRAQEEMRGAKWTAAEQGLNNIIQNLGAFSQENKANYLTDQQLKDQAFLTGLSLSKYGGKFKKKFKK